MQINRYSKNVQQSVHRICNQTKKNMYTVKYIAGFVFHVFQLSEMSFSDLVLRNRSSSLARYLIVSLSYGIHVLVFQDYLCEYIFF